MEKHRNMSTDKFIPYLGVPVEGYSVDNIEAVATVQKCDSANRNQFVGCRRHGTQSSLKMLFQEGSFFVDDVTEPWDKVQVAGGFYAGNYSHWVQNTDNFDICHHSVVVTGNAFLLWEGPIATGTSYTYSEAEEKCKEQGATLATEAQLNEKLQSDDISSCFCAWGGGNVAYSVMRTKDRLCPRSAPSGGVKSCYPAPAKADAWCFKGSPRPAIDVPWAVAIWLYNASFEGVQERDSSRVERFICKKESQWHCPEPPDIFRATLMENPKTSYSYLGTTQYECDPGYWFERGAFTKQLLCTSDLEWMPSPEDLMCTKVVCSDPPDIVYARKVVYGTTFLDRVTYSCTHGYWFQRNVFSRDVICSGYARWHPSIKSLRCSPVECDPPPELKYSQLETYSFEYTQNATYTCDRGYWFTPGVTKMDITCNADGDWVPFPYLLVCWEIVCPPPQDQMLAEWTHVDRKTTIMSCIEGYQLSAINSTVEGYMTSNEVQLKCGLDGQWFPDSSHFLCTEILCQRPPKVPFTDDTLDPEVQAYEYSEDVAYHCNPGRYLRYIFTPYSLSYGVCLYIGDDKFVYASEKACGTARMLQLHWRDIGNRDGPMELVDAVSGLCLATREIPTKSSSVKYLSFEDCIGSSRTRRDWICSKHGVSDLILLIKPSSEFYLTINFVSGLVHTTVDKNKGIEFISYEDRNDEVELDLCRFRDPHFIQRVTCLKAGVWHPDASLIQCLPSSCPKPPSVPYADVSIISNNPEYAAAATYTCDQGYEYLRGRNRYVSRCSDMGTWVPDPEDLPCKKLVCPPYRLPPGTVIIEGNINDESYGSELRVACPPGSFFETGVVSVLVRCEINRRWNETQEIETCKPVDCKKPPDVENTTVTATGDYLYNTLARYVCNIGLKLENGKKWQDVYCTAAGIWEPDPTELKCVDIECEDPGMIPHTQRHDVARKSEAYLVGTVVMYKCETGRWLMPGMRKVSVTCRDDGEWYPDLATIYCQEMKCSKPEPIPRFAFIAGNDYAFASTLRITCEPGFRMQSKDSDRPVNYTEITCTRRHRWEPDLTGLVCLRVSCPEPPDVPNAYYLDTNSLFESYVQYICETGYWLYPAITSRLARCNENGVWIPSPSTFGCRKVDCGHPGTFFNTDQVNTVNGTEYGAYATVQCREGFWLDGVFERQMFLRCSGDGLWEPPPENVKCVGVVCADPSEVQYATRKILPPYDPTDVVSTDPITGGLFYDHGVRIEYKCIDGWNIAFGQQAVIISCQEIGNWSVDIQSIRCIRTTCKEPQPILHGYVSINPAITSSTYFTNSTVQYSCDEGYWFQQGVHKLTVTCLSSGNWDTSLSFSCIGVTCPEPPSLSGATFVATGLTYSHTARYSCSAGFTIKPDPVSVCNNDGVWEPNAANMTCEAVYCVDLPTIPHASVVGNVSNVGYNSAVQYQCEADYFFALGQATTDVTCGGDTEWIGANKRCLHKYEFECQLPAFVSNSYFVSSSSRAAVLRCQRGYAIRSGSSFSLEQELTCDDSGTWTPSSATCQERLCPTPSVSGPHTVVSNATRNTVGVVVDIRCTGGSVFEISLSDGPNSWKRSISATCDGFGKWLPDLSTLTCSPVNCGTPQPVVMAKVTYSGTDYLSEAVYQCVGRTSYGGTYSINVTCIENGRWQPDVSGVRCMVQRCPLPVPPPNSVISVLGYDFLNTSAENEYQYMRITCNTGYQIANLTFTFVSQEFNCSRDGTWYPDPSFLKCIVATCKNLPGTTLSPMAYDDAPVPSGPPFVYGTVLVYECPRSTWFAPENVTRKIVRCAFNGTWQPPTNSFVCEEVTCHYLPVLEHATVRRLNAAPSSRSKAPDSLIREGLQIGAQWRYSCHYGYRISAGVYSHLTTCRGDGSWVPPPEDLRCEEIRCEIPPIYPNIVNGTLVTLTPRQAYEKFRHGTTFTYSCLRGFWMSDGVNKSTTMKVTCLDGEWKPDPASTIRCVLIVCDTIHAVLGARTDGIFHVYQSSVMYTCARGQFFAEFKTRRINATCGPDGRWSPDPTTLFCSDVICDDLELEGAIRTRYGITIDSSPLFTCRPTSWFRKGITQMATTCGEDGVWLPDLTGLKCVTIDCGEPPVENVLVPFDDYSYGNQVELTCEAGYSLTPDTSIPPEIICDISGKWYPDPSGYSCVGVTCPLPRFIRHGAITGKNTFSKVVTVQCDPGYFIRRGADSLQATCQHDATWSEDLNTIFCSPFECSIPKRFDNLADVREVSSVSSPQYRSELEFQCKDGFWVGPQEHSRKVSCSETGLWKPPVDFSCTEIRCEHPPNKRYSAVSMKGNTNQTDYPIGTKMRYDCTEASWLSAQHVVTEWAFTGLLGVDIECEKSGFWKPHPDSFACRNFDEGPLPVGYSRGISGEQVEYEAWLEEDEFLTKERMDSPYLATVKTGDPRWLDGSMLRSSMVRAGSPSLPGQNESNAWDGDTSTSWQAAVTTDRRYTLGIYLGRLYLIEGIDTYSGLEGSGADRIAEFSADFSPFGKFFNESASTTASSRGRAVHQNIRDYRDASSSKLAILDFSYPAKFIQVVITETRNIRYAPTLHEVKVLATPVRWVIQYPYDFITIPVSISVMLLLYALIAIWAYKQDQLDKYKVQFAWHPSDGFVLDSAHCYVLVITVNEPTCIKHFLIRLLGSNSSSQLMMIDSSFQTSRVIVVLPSHCNFPQAFHMGFIDFGSTEKLNEEITLEVELKVGVMDSDELLYGRMPWIFAKESIHLYPDEPAVVKLHKDYQTLRRTTVHHIASFSLIFWGLYHLLVDHMLITIPWKDFISQTSRLDRLLLVSLGSFWSLFISFTLFRLEFVLPAYKYITCFGIAALSSLLALPFLVGAIHVFLRFPVYRRPRSVPLAPNYTSLYSLPVRKSLGGLYGNFLSAKSVASHAKGDASKVFKGHSDFIGSNLLDMLKKFKKLDRAHLARSKSTTTTFHPESITDTLDSCLLPGLYRRPLHRYGSISSTSSIPTICTLDLQLAFDKRKVNRHRRSRSAPAVMQYKGPPRWDYKDRRLSKDVSSTHSLPVPLDYSDEGSDEESRLSCASMWSNYSIVEQWHRVHTSVKHPIESLFAHTDRIASRGHPDFEWYDPTYKRIHSEFHRPGLRTFPVSQLPQWLKHELAARGQDKKGRLPLVSSAPGLPDQDGSCLAPPKPTHGVSTQYPSDTKLTVTPLEDVVVNVNVDQLSAGRRSGSSRNSRSSSPNSSWRSASGGESPIVPEMASLEGSSAESSISSVSSGPRAFFPFSLFNRSFTFISRKVPVLFRKRGTASGASSVPHNRAQKVVFPSGYFDETFVDDTTSCLKPSSGGKFSKRRSSIDDQSLIYSDVSLLSDDGHASEAPISVPTSPRASIAGSVSSKRRSTHKPRRKPPVLITTPAAAFYKVVPARATYYKLLGVAIFLCLAGVLGVGFRTVNVRIEVLCLFVGTAIGFWVVTLSLEAILHQVIYKSRDRLSLSTVRYTVDTK